MNPEICQAVELLKKEFPFVVLLGNDARAVQAVLFARNLVAAQEIARHWALPSIVLEQRIGT